MVRLEQAMTEQLAEQRASLRSAGGARVAVESAVEVSASHVVGRGPRGPRHRAPGKGRAAALAALLVVKQIDQHPRAAVARARTAEVFG
jgi:hypothetical protein